MSTVYELKQQQQELLDSLFWMEEGDTEAEIILVDLLKVDGAIERKLSFLSDVLAESIALSQLATERRKIAQERLERKEKQAKKAEEKLREFILSVMHDFNIKSVKGDILNVSRYERDSLITPNEINFNRISPEFKREKIELDKAEITRFLKNGGVIECFEMVKKDCLRIS
jgi:hypothetical protein